MKNKKSRWQSPAKKVVVIILSVLLGITALFTIVRVGEKLAFIPFFSNAKGEFNALTGNGYVAQGFDFVESENTFLSCGYATKKGNPSAVYSFDEKGNNRKVTLLKNADGSAYVGHTGGIAHYGNYAFITGADGCDVFMLADFIQGKSEAIKVGEIASPTGHDPAFVTVHGNKLYEGSFYRKGNYETPQNERMTTPCGDENFAIVYVYQLGASDNFGVSQTPIEAYSVCGLVQGMEFCGDKIALSTSWGLVPSHIKFYDTSSIVAGQFSLNGTNIPLYYLDSSCLVNEVTAPPMSEEMVYKNGRLFIMNESASDKYIFGKFTSGVTIFSYDVSKI